MFGEGNAGGEKRPSEPLTFRLLLLGIIGAFVAHRGFYHRGDPDEAATAVAGESDSAGSDWLALPALGATAVWLAAPGRLAGARLPWPGWLRWLGAGVAAAGFGLLQWAQVTLAGNWSNQPRLLHGQTLTTDGPYRHIRHPIYTAFLLILGSPLLIAANWAVGLPWLLMTALDVRRRVAVEEALLAEVFGEAFEAYVAGTGALWPRITSNRKQGTGN